MDNKELVAATLAVALYQQANPARQPPSVMEGAVFRAAGKTADDQMDANAKQIVDIYERVLSALGE